MFEKSALASSVYMRTRTTLLKALTRRARVLPKSANPLWLELVSEDSLAEGMGRILMYTRQACYSGKDPRLTPDEHAY